MNQKTTAVRLGGAFAATVALAYAACAFLFWLLPDAAAAFMSALFHGLDFRRLQGEAAAFSFAGFAYALVGLALWAFLFGTLFAWLRRRIA